MAPATTSPTSAPSSNRPAPGRSDAPRRHAARGFTLVELLVVIGIIVLLLGIMAPTITRAWRAGDRAATYADLQAIAAGLDAYRNDHGEYPRVTPPLSSKSPIDHNYNGARMLCRALVGPGPAASDAAGTIRADDPKIPDGAGGPSPIDLGPGFRSRPGGQGKVWGPYINLDKFKLGNALTTGPAGQPGHFAILDRTGNPILYYAGTGKPNIRVGPAFIGDYTPSGKIPALSLFNGQDNFGAMPVKVFRQMMGDTDANGGINGNESPAHEGPYILWAAGTDGYFGPNPPPTTNSEPDVKRAVEKCDDITNFRK